MAKEYNLSSGKISELKKHIDALEDYCLQSSIPMYVTALIKDSEEKSEYYRAIVTPNSIGLKPHEDQINEHMKVANGFKTVPPREAFHISLDDLYRKEK